MLTKEQQKLAADHHNLIYWFAKYRNLDFDEFYDVLAIGLCIAAKLFDPSLGFRFSTLAFKCMQHELSEYYRRGRRMSEIPKGKTVYLYTPLPGSENGLLTYFDVLSNSASNQYTIDETLPETMDFLKKLTPQQRAVISGLLDGMLEEEVAQKLGCTKANVSRIRVGVRKRWNAYSCWQPPCIAKAARK